MSDRGIARVELTLRMGRFGERVETVVVPINEMLAYELTEPVELSDEPLSIALASPGLFGGYGDAVTIRKRKFQLREDAAKGLARDLVKELVKLFGTNDETDGYRKRDHES